MHHMRKMHMLSMKFLYQFPLPIINREKVGRGGSEGAGATSTSPKFDLYYFDFALDQ